MKYSLLLGCTVALICWADGAMAKTPAEIEIIAKAVTVEIKLANSVGSGIIVHRQGDLYTLITNRHVVCGKSLCSRLPAGETYRLGLADGQKYSVSANAVKLLGQDLDLAMIQFRSQRSYSVAQVADPGSLKVQDTIYTAGYPTQQGFSFNEGKSIAVANRRLDQDKGGYTVVYDAETQPGMSGGGVFDQEGKLVAIHGVGDRYQPNTFIQFKDAGKYSVRPFIDRKIGINRGISIRWAIEALSKQGVDLRGRQRISPVPPDTKLDSADRSFIAGLNLWIGSPATNAQTTKREAIQKFSEAIRLNPSYPNAYAMRADTYAEFKEYRQALDDYNKAIAIDPQNASYYQGRGNARRKSNDIQGALNDFDKSLVLRPNSANTYFQRGILKQDYLQDLPGALKDMNQGIEFAKGKDSLLPSYLAILAGLKYEMNNTQEALADYDRAISIDSKSSSSYIGRGMVKYVTLKDNQGAINDVTLAIAIEPSNASLYQIRGTIKYIGLNDHQGALMDLDKSISLSEDAIVYGQRAGLKLFGLNDFIGALADYDKAIILDPKNSMFYFNRGFLRHQKLNDFTGALADYDKAIALDPNNMLFYINRHLVRDSDEIKDYRGAIADMTQVIRIQPSFTGFIVARGWMKLRRLKDAQGALADFNQVIAIDKSGYNARAILKYQNLNDPQGALADFDRAIIIDPKSGASRYNRGDFYYAQGNFSKAVTDFQQVIQLDANSSNAIIAKGVIALIQNQPVQAIEQFNKAQQQEPNNPDIYKYRGVAYQKQGKKAEAIADWQKAAQFYQKNNSTADHRLVTKWIQSLSSNN
jgi:tetratricopeptide (TPR) repeat protein